VVRPIRFQVVRDLRDIPGAALGEKARELGAFVREGDCSSIVLLQGLPEPLLIETAAHELAHVWQSENCPPSQDLILKEGFAQWVAAQALQAFRHPEALQVLRERPDLYGQGFRRLESIEREQGRAFLLRYIKETH
jgi:hypothetical protein